MPDWMFWSLLWLLLALIFCAGWMAVHRGQDDAWDDWDDEVRAHEAWLAGRERERRRPLESWRDDDPAA